MTKEEKAAEQDLRSKQEEGQRLATLVNQINRYLNRKGATLIALEKVKPYEPVPEGVEQANEKVLKANPSGLNVNGWVRSVMKETKGEHSEAELKEFLQTLQDDEVIVATPGKGREKILTLK